MPEDFDVFRPGAALLLRIAEAPSVAEILGVDGVEGLQAVMRKTRLNTREAMRTQSWNFRAAVHGGLYGSFLLAPS